MFNKVIITTAVALGAATRLYAVTLSPAEQGLFSTRGDAPLRFLSEWLYPGLIAASALLAVVMITIAGFQWMAGAVSPPQVDAAKKRIWAAAIGLTLALGSWLILYTINPDLITLKRPAPVAISGKYFCGYSGASYDTLKECENNCKVEGLVCIFRQE